MSPSCSGGWAEETGPGPPETAPSQLPGEKGQSAGVPLAALLCRPGAEASVLGPEMFPTFESTHLLHPERKPRQLGHGPLSERQGGSRCCVYRTLRAGP